MADEYINKAEAIETLMQMQWHDEDGYPVEDADIKRQYAEDWVNSLPTIEIVHCEECESRESGTYYCLLHSMMVNSDYFCADGERGSNNNGKE